MTPGAASWARWIVVLAAGCHNGSPAAESGGPRAVEQSQSGRPTALDQGQSGRPTAGDRARGTQQAKPAPGGAHDEVGTRRSPSASPPGPASPVSTQGSSDSADDTSGGMPTSVQEALAYDPKDPLADLEKADVLDGPTTAVQGGGPCQPLSPPQRLWQTPARLAITVAGPEFVVAGYTLPTPAADDRGDPSERVFVVSMTEQGLPKPLRTMTVDPPHPGERKAAPGLAARDDGHVTLAVVDGAGKLGMQGIDLSSPRAPGRLRAVASGVDSRFAPAVSHVDAGTLIAYTEGSTPMRTHVALVPADSKPPTRTNVTPPQLGATAPTFVRGAYPPQLFVVDARDGMSPLLRVSVTPQGGVRPGEVVVPVGMVASPPQLAVARTGFGTVLAYAGIGSAATTAVGVIDVAPKVGAPSALVKGIAYLPLSVSAESAPDALYFAVDAPRRPGKRPPREIHLVRIDAKGVRETTVVQGPGGDAYGAAIARNGVGTIALAFNSPTGAHVARFRCN
ncbi:MAG: hypothetical protein OXU20_02545 [Myxococcales bacterium]|nr:hypothetical protein [Myxococcales bacterium]